VRHLELPRHRLVHRQVVRCSMNLQRRWIYPGGDHAREAADVAFLSKAMNLVGSKVCYSQGRPQHPFVCFWINKGV
jgi:hypothetical protein